MLKFLKVREENLELILKWRTQPEVTKYMINNVETDMSKQRRWFENISTSDSYKYWLISYQEVLIGVINLADIDYQHKHCTWGYYIGESDYLGLGGIIPPYLYNYVFFEMNFKKIFGEVLEENTMIMKLHQLHGYRSVGVYKDHVYKNGKYHDLFLVELLDHAWLALQKKYKNCVAVFEECNK